ncbi:MAG: DUF5687 family protein, partial [Bacteroidota bacterium]|nr:DUF5687 family protein [Bacteroidota bacterium]
FMVYGFIFYDSGHIDNTKLGLLLFASFFITNGLFVNYGQFLFGWQSAHFDGLLSNKIELKDFIKAKFLLFTIFSSATFILCSLYGLMNWRFIALQLAAYLYTIGFGTVIILYFATMNCKRMDISLNARFNWQGSSYIQWVMSIPLFLIPTLLYLPFNYFHLPYYGVGAVAVFGLITLLMRSFWIDLLSKKLIKQRYKIAEGFRE